MSTNLQFSIAVHIMAALGYMGCDANMSSSQLAKSINANASFVRRVLAKLSKAGLVRTSKGKSGCCSLAKTASSITLLDIYQAVEAPQVFTIHEYEDQKSCIVSCGIKSSLENILTKTQKAMEKSLTEVRLSDVVADLKRK
jgi:Rrf2 family protein